MEKEDNDDIIQNIKHEQEEFIYHINEIENLMSNSYKHYSKTTNNI